MLEGVLEDLRLVALLRNPESYPLATTLTLAGYGACGLAHVFEAVHDLLFGDFGAHPDYDLRVKVQHVDGV